jgi:hypothetical protein
MADLETQTNQETLDTRDVVAQELDKLEQTEEKEEAEVKESDTEDQKEEIKAEEKPQEDQQEEQKEVEEEVKQEEPRRNPFSAWKKEAQSALSALPAETQQYIIEREQQFHKGIQSYKNDAYFGRSISKALSPHNEYLQQVGITPEQAISRLIASEKALRTGTPEQKTQAFLKLAHDYGIDVHSLSQIPFDARAYSLERQIAQQQEALEQLSQSRQAEQEAQLGQTIEQFAQTREHFEEVRETMADLLEKGLASDLDDAYNKAIRLNDDLFARVQQPKIVNIQQANQAAKAAKAAAVSVKGSPVGVTRSAEPKSTEEAVREAMANLGL